MAMSVMERAGYTAGFLIYLVVWVVSLMAYIHHIMFTVTNATTIEYSGYLVYLVAGIFFPPLGVCNGIVMFLT